MVKEVEPTRKNVIYTSTRMVGNVGGPDFHNQLLSYKSLEWAYEREVRVFTTFSPLDTDFEKHAPDKFRLSKYLENASKRFTSVQIQMQMHKFAQKFLS